MYSATPIASHDIEWTPLREEEILLSVPVGHPLATRRSINLIEVAQEPFISINSEHGLRKITDDFCRQAGFEPNIAFQIADPGVINQLVELELGVTFTPELSLNSSDQTKSVQLHIDEPKCQRTIGIALHKKHFRSEAAEHFIKFAIDFFNKLL